MSWNYKTSHDRVEKHLDDMGEIEVEKLVRDADLNSLLWRQPAAISSAPMSTWTSPTSQIWRH